MLKKLQQELAIASELQKEYYRDYKRDGNEYDKAMFEVWTARVVNLHGAIKAYTIINK